jgi:threonine/homoserine/homoserine lactone efflux protein
VGQAIGDLLPSAVGAASSPVPIRARPKWMATIDSFSAGTSLLLGAALSAVNPKNLALTLAAAASIAQAGLDGGGTAVVIAAFVVIGSLTVAGAVLYFLIAAQRAAAPLRTIEASWPPTTPSS